MKSTSESGTCPPLQFSSSNHFTNLMYGAEGPGGVGPAAPAQRRLDPGPHLHYCEVRLGQDGGVDLAVEVEVAGHGVTPHQRRVEITGARLQFPQQSAVDSCAALHCCRLPEGDEERHRTGARQEVPLLARPLARLALQSLQHGGQAGPAEHHGRRPHLLLHPCCLLGLSGGTQFYV